MKNALDSDTIKLPFPHCGKKSTEVIGKLKTKTNFTFGHCKIRFDLDASELRREIAKVEKPLAQLSRTLSRLGK